MSFVTTALGVANLIAPSVIGLFSGKKGEAVAESVLGLAKSVTGADSYESAVETLKVDPEAATRFSIEVMEHKERFIEMAYADRQDARDSYRDTRETADSISIHIMDRNLWVILLLVVTQVLSVYFLKDEPAVLATISGIFGFVVKGLLDERKDVTGFYLGGSLDGRKATEETRKQR